MCAEQELADRICFSVGIKVSTKKEFILQGWKIAVLILKHIIWKGWKGVHFLCNCLAGATFIQAVGVLGSVLCSARESSLTTRLEAMLSWGYYLALCLKLCYYSKEWNIHMAREGTRRNLTFPLSRALCCLCIKSAALNILITNYAINLLNWQTHF